MKRGMIRQGDVLLMPLRKKPSGVTKAASGEVILAHGETTGHKHRFADGSNVVSFYKEGAEDHTMAGGSALVGGATAVAAIKVPKGGATLEHAGGVRADHAPLPVEPGLYEVRRQREYVAPGVERAVVD